MKRWQTVTIVVCLLLIGGTIFTVVKHTARVSASKRAYEHKQEAANASSTSEQGAASFIGKVSNAVTFVQWTRAGQTVTGSFRKAITKTNSLGLENTEKAFTGTISGDGIALNVSDELGESTSDVGEVKENGFTLDVPGEQGTIITVDFTPGSLAGYNKAVEQLFLSRFSSPCSLYVSGHAVHVSFTGADSADDCARFVLESNTEWTTTPQAEVGYGRLACELVNRASEKVIVTDSGSQEYGKGACTQLSGEGWG